VKIRLMKNLIHLLTNSTRNQAIGLLTIGLAMFACSDLAEQVVTRRTPREAVQLLIILAGLAATALLFRRGNTGTHRH
jgi:predicted MFS family arabinose efflux permease